MKDNKNIYVEANLEELEPFNDQQNKNKEQNEDNKSWKGKFSKFLESHRFHQTIVALVVTDCLCVGLELLIEHIELYVLGPSNPSSPSHYEINSSHGNHSSYIPSN